MTKPAFRKTIDDYYLLPIGAYALLSFIALLGVYFAGFIDVLPFPENLGKFDVHFYRSIKNDGYLYAKGQQCNSGFFPLFPYLWQITGLGKTGMAIFNGFVYLTGLAFLCKLLQPDKIILGFFMASPFLFFMWVPLSEPLFLCCCTMILYGLVQERNGLLFLGIFLASMTRASFLFFIPAFVGMAWMTQPLQEVWKKILFLYLLPCILGIVAVLSIQYLQTGVWGAYFEVQYNVWERQFNWPTFPLYRIGKIWIFRWSLVSFWMGMAAAAWGLWYLWLWIKGKKISDYLSKIELFSIIFLVMSLISIVFFNPRWAWFQQYGYGVTYLGGVNRYIHANAFFLIFLLYCFRLPKLTWKQLAGLLVATQLLWFLNEPTYWDHISKFWKVSAATVLLLPLWLYHRYRWQWLGYAIICGGFLFQALMYGYFMTDNFVD